MRSRAGTLTQAGSNVNGTTTLGSCNRTLTLGSGKLEFKVFTQEKNLHLQNTQHDHSNFMELKSSNVYQQENGQTSSAITIQRNTAQQQKQHTQHRWIWKPLSRQNKADMNEYILYDSVYVTFRTGKTDIIWGRQDSVLISNARGHKGTFWGDRNNAYYDQGICQIH